MMLVKRKLHGVGGGGGGGGDDDHSINAFENIFKDYYF